MLPHILICIALSLCVLIEQRRQQVYSLIISILIIILFMMLSNPYWGVDTHAYEEYYYIPASQKTVLQLLQFDFFATPFLLFSKLITVFAKTYWAYKIIIFSFNISVIVFFITKYATYKSIALLVFISISSNQLFFSLRQVVAFSFFLLSIHFWNRKKILISLGLLTMSIFIHFIAIIGIGVWGVMLFKKRFCPWFIVMLIIFFYRIASKIIYLITIYYRGGLYKNIALSNGGYTLLIAQFIVLMTIHVIFIARKIKEKNANFYYNCYVIACGLQIIAIKFATFNRVQLFFTWSIPLLISKIIEHLNKSSDKLIAALIVCILASAFYLSTFALKYPYQSIF